MYPTYYVSSIGWEKMKSDRIVVQRKLVKTICLCRYQRVTVVLTGYNTIPNQFFCLGFFLSGLNEKNYDYITDAIKYLK
jgi:hypothetical protein